MLEVDKVLVSEDVINEEFVCNLSSCKGACCVEGDLGAPLANDELIKVDEVIEKVKSYLPKEAIAVLENDGGYLKDEDGDISTTTIDGKECAFAFYDDKSTLKCSIEQAYIDGKTDFKKPISCHLYPIRIVKLPDYEALNYDRWEICSAACALGKDLKIKVYQFLKEPLIRKFGEKWYTKLQSMIE